MCYTILKMDKNCQNIFTRIMTRFDKSRLPHTQWQGWLFITTRFLHQWTNNPCVYHCQWFPSLLFLGLVSWACLMCSNAWVVFKGSGMTGQASRLLEITTWLARELGHQIGYYLWNLELKQASNETIWQCSTCTHWKTHHFVALHHPQSGAKTI